MKKLILLLFCLSLFLAGCKGSYHPIIQSEDGMITTYQYVDEVWVDSTRSIICMNYDISTSVVPKNTIKCFDLAK